MEGGNKVNIDLESPLDISSSDMLVPLNRPTFQHNWQRYQGKYLPNSLRFEKNGWAVGWNVVDFKYNFLRISQDGLFFESSKLNDNPTYLLSIFDSESSNTPVGIVAYSPDSKLLMAENCTATLAGDVISGVINGNSFVITWDRLSETATISGSNIALEYEQQNDKTWSFKIIDSSLTLHVNNDIYPASSLNGTGMSQAADYLSFNGVQHEWNGYIYSPSSNRLIAEYADDIITPTVSGNTIKFSYSATVDEELSLTYTVDKYYIEFDDLKFTTTVGDDLLVSQDASKDVLFNYWSGNITPSKLTAGDSKGVLVDVKVPMFLTVSAKAKVDYEQGAVLPNNTAGPHIQFKTGAYFTDIVVQSIFDEDSFTYIQAEAGTLDGRKVGANKGWNYLGIETFVNKGFKHRYCTIDVKNTIMPSAGFYPYRYELVPGTIYCFAVKRFANFSSAKLRVYMQNMLGKVAGNYLYSDIKEGKFKITDYFENNKWVDYSDYSNAFYTVADLSTVCPIKKKGEEPIAEEYTIDEYFEDNFYDDEALRDNFLTKLNFTPETYKGIEPYKTYDELYDGDTYIGGTYEQTDTSFEPDRYFWPFDYAPMFNYKVKIGTDAETGEDIFEEYQDVYYVSKTGKVVTDFDEFRMLVLGSYDATKELQNAWYRTVEKYNPVREVSCWDRAFDFDYEGINSDSSQRALWDLKWTKWYKLIQNPADLPKTADPDDTYLDYSNITVSRHNTLNLKRSDPGYVLGVGNFGIAGESVPVPQNDFVLWQMAESASTEGVSAVEYKVYHNHQDVTNLYTLDTTDYGGAGLLVYFRSRAGRFKAFIYPVFGLYNFDDGSNQKIIETWEVSGGSVKKIKKTYVEPGTLNVTLKANSERCWAKEIRLMLRAGEVYSYNKTFVTAESKETDDDGVEYTTYDIQESNSKRESALADGIEAAYATQLTAKEGLIYMQPVWGHLLSRVKFVDKIDELTLTKGYKDYFVTQKVADSEIPSANKNKLYIDRDTLPHSYKWFELNSTNLSVTSAQLQVSYECKPLDSKTVLYYGKDVYSGSSADTIKKETASGYYPPIVDSEGNMAQATQSLLSCVLQGTPVTMSVPNALQLGFTPKTKDLYHVFYTSEANLVTGGTTAVGTMADVNMTTGQLPITLGVNGKTVQLYFNIYTTATTVTKTQSVTLGNSEIMFSPSTVIGTAVDLPVQVKCNFKDVTGKFLASGTDKLLSYTDNKATLQNGIAKYVYNDLAQRIEGLDVVLNVTESINKQNIKFDYEQYGNVSAVMSNVINNKTRINYAGTNYDVDISKFLISSSAIKIMSTDIRKPDDTKFIGEVELSDEFQLIKQQWNSTIEVENFWWIDDTHILELNQYDLVLKRKSNELDDWLGDKFITVDKKSRSEILTSNVRYYCVTNTYSTDQCALLLVFKPSDTYTCACEVYNVCTGFKLLSTLYFKIVPKKIGQKLVTSTLSGSTAYFNTYSSIDTYELLCRAKWSSTITDGRLFIGCHVTTNLDQWTVVARLKDFKVESCIQGYGFVSLKGELTGGMIPSDYFSSSTGFTGTVQDLSVLSKTTDANDADKDYLLTSLNKLNTVDTKIVGTAERQWYIKKQLYGIVSHLIYSGNGQFKTEVLPITNVYDSCYKSPSYKFNAYGDLCVQPYDFKKVFTLPSAAKSVWNTFMTGIGSPQIFMFNPRHSTLVYLQQTFGQYAYVHYNSSESMEVTTPKDNAGKNPLADAQSKLTKQNAAVLTDDFTFDKQIIRQTCEVFESTYDFYKVLFAAFAPTLQHIDKNLVVNGEVNQQAISDNGKKYTQNALENLMGLTANAIMTEAMDSGLTSTVVGLKSLDMFYSTSDKQNVYAGPGFVEHQLVADCVAQSTTDVHAEGSVQQIAFTIRSLTSLQGAITLKLQQLAADGLDLGADATAKQMVCGNSLGLAGVAMHAAATALRVAAAATEVAYNELDKVLDAFCARGITCEQVGRVSRHSLTSEGKHKYGEKHETFIWPCFGVPSAGLTYTDESVQACIKQSTWTVSLMASKYYTNDSVFKQFITYNGGVQSNSNIQFSSKTKYTKSSNLARQPETNNCGAVPFYQAALQGKMTKRTLPSRMACIQGVPLFLPEQPFKNENIGASDPVFTPSMFQDYIIDEQWQLAQSCTYGEVLWVSCKDTKLINCAPSNMRVTDNFCGIASPYTAIEVKRGLSKEYMRPWAITPNALAFNSTGYNCVMDNKLYHAFDGYSYRLVEWVGAPGMMKNNQTYWYSFQVNDRLKRSNKCPANECLGNFVAEPVQSIKALDRLWSTITVASKQKGMEGGTIGEDKDNTRWALPIFTEPVTTLPAAVKTLTAMPLRVEDGITGLVTDLANNQTAYKAPLSVDFTLGKNVYRVTEEYICSVETTEDALDIVTDIVPILGLTYIGATPTEAYFYSKATRCYYVFTGGSNLTKMDMMERFRDVQGGFWDFVNQEVVLPCLMTFKRLNAEVDDKDTETDNIIVPVMSKGQVSGELIPPLTTVFNDRSWYKVVSLPSGLAYQGPNRVIINRAIFVEYMLDTLKGNLGKWDKMGREKYTTKRSYPEVYSDILTDITGVDGWTHNPFLLVTSALGNSEDTDCLYEWEITFCWPIEMDLIYTVDNYAVVNVTAETMTPGGKVKSRPTHVFLTKDLFTRNGNYGYYSFRYQSKNGAGNRERLHIWSDQYIAISSITCESKVVTSRRTEILTQQVDVKGLKEL